MLPNIDSVTAIQATGNAPAKRTDTDRVAEMYKTAAGESAKTDAKVDAARTAVSAAEKASSDDRKKSGEAAKDQVEINFSLTREERAAFVSAFNSKQNPETMSDEEKETLKKASERISKFIDDAIARNADSRERVEKAVGEWYARITRGEQDGPADLIQLLRQAAMGNLDDLGK